MPALGIAKSRITASFKPALQSHKKSSIQILDFSDGILATRIKKSKTARVSKIRVANIVKLL
jgi:hypothetical protein